MAFLMAAGYADMISGVYRSTIWNQTIPSELRGRLAGIEMISYLSGPMLGNTQLGILAGMMGVRRAITLSSIIGLAAVAVITAIYVGLGIQLSNKATQLYALARLLPPPDRAEIFRPVRTNAEPAAPEVAVPLVAPAAP